MAHGLNSLTTVDFIIDCDGSEHRLSSDGGSVIVHDHDVDSEKALVGLGGRPIPCLLVAEAWRSCDKEDALRLAKVLLPDNDAHAEVRRFMLSIRFQTGAASVFDHESRMQLRATHDRVAVLRQIPMKARALLVNSLLARRADGGPHATRQATSRVTNAIAAGEKVDVILADLKLLKDLPTGDLGESSFTENELLTLGRLGKTPTDQERATQMLVAIGEAFTNGTRYTRDEVADILRPFTHRPSNLIDALVRGGILVRDRRRLALASDP
ncbi:MAG: DUF2087 domain-containing protein [Actinomycetota bacterium]|nr:DUF2087 domain-containing protein [Actinomycetota bacterium]